MKNKTIIIIAAAVILAVAVYLLFFKDKIKKTVEQTKGPYCPDCGDILTMKSISNPSDFFKGTKSGAPPVVMCQNCKTKVNQVLCGKCGKQMTYQSGSERDNSGNIIPCGWYCGCGEIVLC